MSESWFGYTCTCSSIPYLPKTISISFIIPTSRKLLLYNTGHNWRNTLRPYREVEHLVRNIEHIQRNNNIIMEHHNVRTCAYTIRLLGANS
jgi:predicted metallo-beta-lactamase superfamily hydrolase